MDEVLSEEVLPGEAHGAELAVHAPREAAIGVDPSAEPVACLEDGDAVPRLLEQERGREPGDAGADDDHVPGLGRAGQALPQHAEGIDDVHHGPTVPDGTPRPRAGNVRLPARWGGAVMGVESAPAASRSGGVG